MTSENRMSAEGRMNAYGCLLVLIISGFMFTMCYSFAKEDKQHRDECAAKGGTYLPHEGVCVEMKTIPLH